MSELARREALVVWLAGAEWADATGDRLREAELAFDAWWRQTSRRQLALGRGRR